MTCMLQVKTAKASAFSVSGQQADGLHMVGPGEEVSRLGLLQVVAPLVQELHIPGQGGRVAGNIDDAVGCHVTQGFDGGLVQTLSGRIHHDLAGDEDRRRLIEQAHLIGLVDGGPDSNFVFQRNFGRHE